MSLPPPLYKSIGFAQELTEEIKGIISNWNIPQEFRTKTKSIDKKDLGELLIVLGQLLGGETPTGTIITSDNTSIRQIEFEIGGINNKNWELEFRSSVLLHTIASLRSEFFRGSLTNTYNLLHSLADNLDKIIVETNKGVVESVNGLPLGEDELESLGIELNDLERECWENFTEVTFQASLVLNLIVNQLREPAERELEELKRLEANAKPQIEEIIRNPDAYPFLQNFVQSNYRTYSDFFEGKLGERTNYRRNEDDSSELSRLEIENEDQAIRIVAFQKTVEEKDAEIARLTKELGERNIYDLAGLPKDLGKAQEFLIRITEEMRNLREESDYEKNYDLFKKLNVAEAELDLKRMAERNKELVEQIDELKDDVAELNVLIGGNPIKSIREKREEKLKKAMKIMEMRNEVREIIGSLDENKPISREEHEKLCALRDKVNNFDYTDCDLNDAESPSSIAKTELDVHMRVLNLTINNWIDTDEGLT